MTRRRLLPRLARDRRGVTVVEFAIVAPVMLALIMGLGDLLYQAYAQSLLDGAIQKAGRDSAIQGGATNAGTLDAAVLAAVKQIAPSATYTATRKSYYTFASIKPEDFTDTNGDGRCDNGEVFTDINGNNTWDVDPGTTGQGGANDVTVYTVKVTYPRLFPTPGLLGFPPTQTLTASTLLKNQPYATQTVVTAKTVKCP